MTLSCSASPLRAALLACAASLALAPALAGAQPAPSHPAAAPEGQLEPPPVPQPPADLAARVERLATIAGYTGGCYTYSGERSAHTADRACPRWYAQLTAGGDAAAYALGAYVLSQVQDRPEGSEARYGCRDGEYDCSFDETSGRIFQLMARTRSRVTAQYLVHIAATAGAREPSTASLALDTLAEMTGWDVAPPVPWRAGPGTDTARRTQLWVRWFRDHGEESAAAWRAAGDSLSRAALASEDPAARFAAVRRLARVPAQRANVAAALDGLIARPDLPAEARAFFLTFARRSHIALPSRRAAATNAAAATTTTSGSRPGA